MLLHRRDENECAFIGERERANLVVQTARIFYDRTSSNCACSRITRFFLSEKISKFSHDVVRIYTCTCVYARVTYSRNHGRISPEKMPFVVEERGKENVVPVRLLSRERLVCISVACAIGNGQGNASPPKQRTQGKLDQDLLRNRGTRNTPDSITSEAIEKGELLLRCALRYLTEAVYTSFQSLILRFKL